jgi:hypothetical protein
MLKLAAILLGVLLLAVSFTTVVGVDQSAYGTKATQKGTRHHTAHGMGNQVCGDEICPGSPYIKRMK